MNITKGDCNIFSKFGIKVIYVRPIKNDKSY